MVKKRFAICCILLTISLITGCGARETTDLSSNTADISDAGLSDIPDYIEKTLSSGVDVKAAVDAPSLDTGNVSNYECVPMKMNTETVCRTLLRGSITQTSEGDDTDSASDFTVYTDESGATLASDKDIWIMYEAADFADIRTDFDDESAAAPQTDFDFADADTADKEIRELLKELGLEVYAKSEYMSYDHITLEKKNLEQFEGFADIPEFQDEIDGIRRIPWSDEYDCYCFTYYGAVDGIKLNTSDRELKASFVPGSIIRAVYSREGIQRLEISCIYTPEKVLEERTLCNLDTVLDSIDRKYNSIILQGDYEVTSMELDYTATQSGTDTYTLEPVWKCAVHHRYETQDKESERVVSAQETNIIYIDAVTGAEIYSGEQS